MEEPMKTFKKSFISFICILLLVSVQISFAQQETGKKILTVDKYSIWRSIVSTEISDNGEWVTYGYRLREGDDTLYVKNLTTIKTYKLPRAAQPNFSDDAKWVAYIVSLPYKEQEMLRKDKKPTPVKAELMNLETGGKHSWENVERIAFAKGSKFLAIKKTKSAPDAKFNGTDLILHNLSVNTDQLIGSVNEYGFNKPGTLLSYTVDAADRNGNGIYIIILSDVATKPLDNDTLEYARLTWDEEGTALAVLKGEKKKGNVEKTNILLVFPKLSASQDTKITYNPESASDFPKDMVISERGNLSWNKDVSMVFLGIKKQEKEPEKKKDEEPVANVDIWHWKDDRIQSVQMIQANTDRNFTYRSVFHSAEKKFVRLTDDKMRRISLTRDGKWGVGQDDSKYISDWKESRSDCYLVNTFSGERKLIFTGISNTMGLSPEGTYFIYWKDNRICGYVIPSGEIKNFTKNASVSFINTEYDNPGTKPSWGIAGWTKDDKAMILNHKYDLYLQPVDGSPAQNLTEGKGTKEEIRFRPIRLDPEQRFIDLSKPVLLSAFSEWTKKNGYFELNNGVLTQLVYEDKRFGTPTKAKNTDKVIFTIETFQDFPNYYVSDVKFINPQKFTDANPQQAEYRWGYRILFDYKNKKGVHLQGTLAIPDDYQKGQKLPMLVQFYEKNSQNLHTYSAPRYASSPQFAGFVSEGYLVMQPDIHFNTRTSHGDMLECIEAAVKKVIEMGYVDPKRIGLHGHSYSGQGSAYISTHSNLFAAIIAGAAATDLVSDFNQLWKSAGTNQHRYDIYGQGRFGTNPYDDLKLYIDQSAVFSARNMNTPLLLLHGTDDGSVEWLQAVEFYNALRFNGKNVILLSYPGEGHSLSKLENQKDFLVRMMQFYDHYLKDKPASDWITIGVPFLKKGK
jgi:dienelactone hydrolase